MDAKIDVDLQKFKSKLKINSLTRSQLHNELVDEMEKWQMSLMGRKYDDMKYIAEFTSMTFSECKQLIKMLTYGQFVIWFFFIDDKIEGNIESNDLWIRVLTEDRNISNTLEEKMFISFWTEMKKSLTEEQRKSFKDSWISFVESNKRSNKDKEFWNKCSINEYLNYREHDFNTNSLFIAIQYVLEIAFDENTLNNNQMKILKKLFSEYLLVSNDIYSFNKDLKDGSKHNIIYVINRVYDVNYQKSSIIALDLLSSIEDKVLECISQIKSSNINISNEFLIAVENYLVGNIEYYRNANRYK